MTETILCMIGMFLAGMFFGYELGRIPKDNIYAWKEIVPPKEG